MNIKNIFVLCFLVILMFANCSTTNQKEGLSQRKDKYWRNSLSILREYRAIFTNYLKFNYENDTIFIMDFLSTYQYNIGVFTEYSALGMVGGDYFYCFSTDGLFSTDKKKFLIKQFSFEDPSSIEIIEGANISNEIGFYKSLFLQYINNEEFLVYTFVKPLRQEIAHDIYSPFTFLKFENNKILEEIVWHYRNDSILFRNNCAEKNIKTLWQKEFNLNQEVFNKFDRDSLVLETYLNEYNESIYKNPYRKRFPHDTQQ